MTLFTESGKSRTKRQKSSLAKLAKYAKGYKIKQESKALGGI